MTIKKRLSGVFHGVDLQPLPGHQTKGYIFKADVGGSNPAIILLFDDGSSAWDDISPDKYFFIGEKLTTKEREKVYNILKSNKYTSNVFNLSDHIKDFSQF